MQIHHNYRKQDLKNIYYKNNIQNYFPANCVRKKSKISSMTEKFRLKTSAFLTKIKLCNKKLKENQNSQ